MISFISVDVELNLLTTMRYIFQISFKFVSFSSVVVFLICCT